MTEFCHSGMPYGATTMEPLCAEPPLWGRKFCAAHQAQLDAVRVAVFGRKHTGTVVPVQKRAKKPEPVADSGSGSLSRDLVKLATGGQAATTPEPVAEPAPVPVAEPTAQRKRVDRVAAAAKLVKLVEATPIEQLPVTRQQAMDALEVGPGVIQEVVNLAAKSGRIESTRGVGAGLLPAGVDPRRAKLLAYLHDHPGAIYSDVADALGISKTSALYALNKAIEDGEIEHTTGYRVTQQMADAA